MDPILLAYLRELGYSIRVEPCFFEVTYGERRQHIACAGSSKGWDFTEVYARRALDAAWGHHEAQRHGRS